MRYGLIKDIQYAGGVKIITEDRLFLSCSNPLFKDDTYEDSHRIFSAKFWIYNIKQVSNTWLYFYQPDHPSSIVLAGRGICMASDRT